MDMDELTATDRHHEDPWSVTRRDLYDELRRRERDEEPTVVARVVDVEGSAYRRPGATMLVDRDADSMGAITAGCLEGPATDLAATVFETGRPVLATFDLTDDDEWGLGLGCNGIVDVLFEPLASHHWRTALAALESRESVAMLTAVASDGPRVDAGDGAVLGTDGSFGSTATLPETLLVRLREQATRRRSDGGAATVSVDTEQGRTTVFVQGLVPSPELLLFGHQSDVHSVARLARQVGFRVTVASARGAKTDAEQFPSAHEVRGTRAADLSDVVDAPTRTYAVLMSHNLTDDALAMESLLKDTDVPYVGLMGPRERFREVKAESEVTGVTYSEAELQRVSTPVGLDLGGGEPAQVALSIVAEALAVHNGREGGRLGAETGPIHDRIQHAASDSQ